MKPSVSRHRSIAVIAPLAFIGLLASARADDKMPAAAQLGVGQMVPAVSVHAPDGTVVNLSETVKTKPAVLIFYRGGWCPYCNTHLGALNEIEADLTAAGYQLLAISPDQPAKLHDAPKRKEKPAYTLLSDQDAAAIDAFGISFVVPDELVAKYKSSYKIDLEADSGRTHHKLPHPAVYIVDSKGKIRFAHVDPDYKKRLDPAKILAAAKAAMDS